MTAPHAPFAALFDLDGVLLDTEPEYTRFWDKVNQLYPTGVENFAHVIKGSTLDKIFARYFPDEQVRHEIYAMLLERELNFRYDEFADAPGFVEVLKNRGVECVIVTSSNRRKMDEVFRQLPSFRERFTKMICDEDVTASKPDPEGYLKGAALAGYPIERCVVFEDSLAGLEAGRRSGAKVVALATSLSPHMLADKADIVVRSFGEIDFDRIATLFKP